MPGYTRDDIRRIVEEEDVEFIRLQFCDIFGSAKNIAITRQQLDKALNNECTFDTAGLMGYTTRYDSEMVLHPDVNTFEIFPWRPQDGKVARMYCDVYTQEGEPFWNDPRQVLKKVLDEVKKKNFRFIVHPVIEFFLFHLDDNGLPTTGTHELAGYLDMAPSDQGENIRRDIIKNLEAMDFNVLSSHHEKSPGQHAIEFRGGRVDQIADRIVTFKMAVKMAAKKHGMYATFLPKPREGSFGSGMHLRFECRDLDGRNLFYDPDDPRKLSKIGYQFIAGILAHIRPMTLVTNPLVNSYKRLIPGYDAPVHVGWSTSAWNRSALIRVISRKPGSTQFELRNPDATCNPYLTLALCIAAGMDGIEKEMTPPEEVRENLFDRSEQFLTQKKIELLPQTLGEAITAFERDKFVQSVLGEEISQILIETKKQEWKEYRSLVTSWEIDRYLSTY